ACRCRSILSGARPVGGDFPTLGFERCHGLRHRGNDKPAVLDPVRIVDAVRLGGLEVRGPARKDGTGAHNQRHEKAPEIHRRSSTGHDVRAAYGFERVIPLETPTVGTYRRVVSAIVQEYSPAVLARRSHDWSQPPNCPRGQTTDVTSGLPA